MEYRELMIGAGKNRTKQLMHPMRPNWNNLTTLDINPDMNPDILHDLEKLPIPLANGKPTPDDYYDEIHAYAILEHLGTQGDAKSFFALFTELWRILKPNGLLFAIVPLWSSESAWGDPSHKRVISQMSLAFLNQEEYSLQVGKTQMTDFRYMYSADLKVEWVQVQDPHFSFVLSCVKPSRIQR